MKRLTKAQWAEITEAMTECNKQADELQAAIEGFNNIMDEASNQVNEKLVEYNNTVQGFRETYSNIAATAQEYYDERSETWQESQDGEAYAEWIGALSTVDGAEEIEIEFPDPIEDPNIPDFTDTSWLPPEAPGEE